MTESFNPSSPIYLQLADRIKNRIIRGEIERGERLPSVRELAIDSGVNPNTVQRTYRELEDSGIVLKQRGQGTYVTEDPQILNRIREELKTRHTVNFVREMRAIGCADDELLTSLQDYLTQRGEGEDHA
ncbi:MAG: GntR family transcriptional regulator [Sporolactobacillus sp.]